MQGMDSGMQQLREASDRYDSDAMGSVLRALVPEFQPIGDHAASQPGPATVVVFPSRIARKT